MDLTADCTECFALCCAALPFEASRDFVERKPAGTPCRNLDGFACSIHERLATSGWRGCTVYDCAGAGQRVAQGSYAGRDWRTHPESAQEMFAVFRATSRVHELLQLIALSPATDAALDSLRVELEQVSGAAPEVVLAVDLDRWTARVVTALAEHSAKWRSGVASSGDARKLSGKGPVADLVGVDLRGLDLAGADLRGALLIAADLRGTSLAGADLLGADLRDARLDPGALDEALFVTDRQRASVRAPGSAD
jgi:uncharacterized protein YjbI with pentapeptide repeats